MELKNKLPEMFVILIVYTAIISFVSVEGYKAYVRNKLTQTLNDSISNTYVSNMSYSSNTVDISNDVEIGEMNIKVKDNLKKDSDGTFVINESSRMAVIVAFNITNKTDKPIEGLVATIDIKNEYGKTLSTIIYNATNELVPQKVCTIGAYSEFKGEKVRVVMDSKNLSATVRKVELKK